MSYNSSSSPPHSDPIPINNNASHRNRPRSASEASAASDDVPPLSPTSESPVSIPSIQTPASSNSRLTATPISPSSPILSYFYGPPNKSPFSNVPTSNRVFEGELHKLSSSSNAGPYRSGIVDEDSPDQSPSPTHPPVSGRRVSTSSWVPVRFGPQQNIPESQSERGAGVLRRLSLSSGPVKPIIPGQHRSASPHDSSGGGAGPPRKPSPPAHGHHRKAATLSAPMDTDKVPRRAPSPMGERILKGFFDGF